MIDVYKLSAGGQIATLVGKVHNSRDIGDKVRVKATTSPLRVIGRGPSSQPGSHAIYCVTEDDWSSGRTIFNQALFGYKEASNATPTFVLCMAATKEEYINSNPSEVYELNTVRDCISMCTDLRDSAKAKGLPDFFAAYVVAEDGSNPWNQVFTDLKITEECFWIPLNDDKCISIWYSPDKQYGDELAMKLEQRASDGSMGPHCEIIFDERYTTSDLSQDSIHKTLLEIYQDAGLPVADADLNSITEKISCVFGLKKPSLNEQIQSASTRANDSHASLDSPVKNRDPER